MTQFIVTLIKNINKDFVLNFSDYFSFIFLPLACLSSRPGQVGRADGYILEGKELEFYLRKIKAKKGK